MDSKKPQTSETYDEMYNLQEDKGPYTLPYKHSCYFPLYKQVRNALVKNKTGRLLEVGCGSGGFAHYLFDTLNITYFGFDFSPVAVDIAKNRSHGHSDLFYTGDATNPESYCHEYDTIVCTEVLEHVDGDLDIIKLWKKNSFCICSVPNFDSQYHVRHFKNKEEVLLRYGELVDINKIILIKKPILEEISFTNKLKHIRWNRYRPAKLLELVGLGDFDKIGGWFLFLGKRK